MLVLTRRPEEKIVIVDEDGQTLCELSLLEINGNKVRVGAVAPASIGIHREEVWKRELARREGR